jgi:hypothetical protein
VTGRRDLQDGTPTSSTVAYAGLLTDANHWGNVLPDGTNRVGRRYQVVANEAEPTT